VPLPGYSPAFNGCGPISLPNFSLFVGWVGQFGLTDFNPACDNHDTCYGTCNSLKTTCDDTFLAQMQAACAATYDPATNPANNTPLAALFFGLCNALAIAYVDAVAIPGSVQENAFLGGQAAACECCPDDAGSNCFSCSCTGTQYTNETNCVNNCIASLSCFTNICDLVVCQ
jgi:hypothetical protein